MFTSADEVLDFIKAEDVKFVDIRFCDLPGVMQHFNVPAQSVTKDFFTEGQAFDGSSIRGFQAIHESDMKLIPDPTTAYVDPFRVEKTLIMNFSIVDPFTDEPYSRDPRNIAAKAEAYLKSTGIADTAYFGAEAEFFVFDDVRFKTGANESYYYVDSKAAVWNTGRAEEGGNLGYKPRMKGGYFPVPPVDSTHDMRAEMALILDALGVPVEVFHHETAGAGQMEIGTKFSTLVERADWTQRLKYVVWNVADRYGKTATFMPKPYHGDNGSGMHVHQSIWKGGKNLFAGKGYAGLSETALFYIGGIIRHARALNAITNPTTNSYKRLVPHFEAPVKLAYSARNRSASIRIPYAANDKARRIEARFPDPMANPYLCFAALMMAGLDGIENKIHPGEAATKDLYHLPPEEDRLVPTVCHSLDQALEALDRDRAFLTRGGVFTDAMLDAYIELKMTEVNRIRVQVNPAEYDMYFSL